MRSRLSDLRREDGIAMITAIMILGIVLGLGGTVVLASTSSSNGTNADELSARAFQAAEAGLQTAVHRLNMIGPGSAQCITTVSATPNAGGWCAPTAAESLGHGQYFSYQVSTQGAACTGTSLGPTVSGRDVVERCIVATGTGGGAPGTAGALTRRVIMRATAFTGAKPFPVSGLLGTDGVSVSNNGNVIGDAGSNGLISLANNSALTGTAYIWTGAPAPTGVVGAVVRGAQWVLAPPSAINPVTRLDGAVSNDNGRLVAGANPSDSCTNGSGTGGSCYTNTALSPRTLSVGNTGSITLGGGFYDFCQINLGNQVALNVSSTAQVEIFLDSPDRPGSGCVAGQGGLTTGNGDSFSNPTGDPRALQIVVYGSTAWPTLSIPNKNSLQGAIYAPNTTVTFQNGSSFVGGITAKQVQLKNNATWDNRLDNFQIATTLVFYRSSWHECSVIGGTVTAPASGCS